MTSGQRVRAALEHRDPDRTPIFEYVLHSPVAERFLGRPYAGDDEVFQRILQEQGYEEAVRRRVADSLDLAEFFAFDMLYFYPGPVPSPSPPAPAPAPGEDPVENLCARIAAARSHRPGFSDARRGQYLALRAEICRRGLDLPILAPNYAHGVWTDTDLMQTMLLAPEVAQEYFAQRTEGALAAVQEYLALGIDQIGVGGDFAGNRPIISANCYRRFILPEVRQVVRSVHRGGARAVHASDGDLWYVIDDFLIASGVDGYIEIDCQAGMDLRRLKERFGGRITFYGNFDCMQVLCFADPAGVRAHARQVIEAGRGGGGHILCCNNAITSAVPAENYLALQNAYRECFGLPALRI
jgi:uroporphyrinogen decarboxylase